MVDLDNIVKTREVEKTVDDDAEHCRLFWQCESFDEYRMKCDMHGIEALFTREDFDMIKDIYQTVKRIRGVDEGTLQRKIFSAGAAI